MRTYDEPECECDSPLKLSQGCRILDKHGNRTTTTIPLLFTPGPLVVMSWSDTSPKTGVRRTGPTEV